MNVATTSQSTKVIKWKDIKTYTANYFSTRFNFSNTKASSILSKDMIFYNPNRGISDGKNPYVLSLMENVKVLPYRLNGDFYLIKKREIEDKVKQKPSKVSTKVVQVKEKEEVIVKKQTKKHINKKK